MLYCGEKPEGKWGMETLFWQRLDGLIKTQKIIIDRPQNTRHPRYPDFIFPLDYGYLEGTVAQDGGGIDLWSGSAPERTLKGIMVILDIKKKDSEIKLLIGCTEEEIKVIEAFHNGHYQSGILIRRPG
jgi:inorganic pyrophosphatase